MAELVDALGLEPSAERRGSSILPARTESMGRKTHRPSFFFTSAGGQAEPKQKKEYSMTAKIKNISDTKKKLDITVKKEALEKYLKKAYQKVGQSAKINGFRKGKIPQNVLDQHYGPQIDYECLNFAINETYPQALTENDLTPMTEPKFDANPLSRDSDYTYSVEVEVKPTFKLKDYKGLKVKKKDLKIDTKEVEEELKRLQDSLAQVKPAKDDAQVGKGHVLTIDFEGTIDGKAFEGGTAKDYNFEFGSGQLLQGFEDALKGLKKGEEKEFDMDFPADYFEKDLAGKKAHYKIKVKDIHDKDLPKIDDEMAKDIGKESLAEVKKEIEDALTKRAEATNKREYAEEIRKKLIKDYKFEVPQSLVDTEIERTKKDKKEIEEGLRLEFVLEAIAREEKIQPTPEDFQNHFQMLSQMYQQPVQEIQKIYSQNNMINTLAVR